MEPWQIAVFLKPIIGAAIVWVLWRIVLSIKVIIARLLPDGSIKNVLFRERGITAHRPSFDPNWGNRPFHKTQQSHPHYSGLN